MKTVFKVGAVDVIVNSIVSELKNWTFLIYCADDARFAEISSKLHQRMPNTEMIGTTGFMLNENGSFGEGISAIGFREDEIQVSTGVIRQCNTSPIKYLPELKAAANKISRAYKNNLCFAFSTGYEEKVVSTMKIVLEAAGIRLIGGTPGNTTPDTPKKAAYNGEVLTDATVFAVIGSKLGKIEIFKENLFHRRPIMHSVTKLSPDSRTIFEIDGRKAMDVYEEELGYTSATVQDGVFKNPLSKIVGTDSYIVAIFSFNPDRSITTYKNVQKNDTICFTEIDPDYQTFMSDNMAKLTQSQNVAGILSINCILRYLFFENNNYTASYAAMMKSMANGCHWGVISDGELYIEQFINQSMVCVIFMKDR